MILNICFLQFSPLKVVCIKFTDILFPLSFGAATVQENNIFLLVFVALMC